MINRNMNKIFSIKKPSNRLLKLYLINSLITGPLFFIVFPPLLFKYLTLQYNFNEDGVSMSWGILFKREVNLTYYRIQDIHLYSGVVHRWLGLADIKIQTASGSADAEMTIEGLTQFEEIRKFLYSKMRGSHEKKPEPDNISKNSKMQSSELNEIKSLLQNTVTELKEARKNLEKISAE